MAGDRECPLCGTTMRLKESDDVVQIPGNPQLSSKRTREWVCPECDYFEEAEEEGA
jgi:ssDNA-binding Zn-finger/Zn-ribbon topoisomerase 1